MNRLRESQMLSSIFPKYAVVVFVIGLYFVAGSVLLSYYVTAAVRFYTQKTDNMVPLLVLTK